METPTKPARNVNQTQDPFEGTEALPIRSAPLPAVFATAPKLIDLVPDPPVYKASEVQGIPICVHSCEFRVGEDGEYVALNSTLADGRTGFVTCGGTIVLQKMKTLVEMVIADKASFPVLLTLVSYPQPKGRSLWRVE